MDSKSNVVVIGGGAIGLCAGYYLSRLGATVTILDKGEMGHGSSLHNAGYVSPSHFVPLAAPGVFSQGLKWMFNPTSPLYIKPRLDLSFLSWAWRFARACDERVVIPAMPLLLDLLLDSSKLFDELARMAGMQFDLTRQGIVMLYATERGRRGCEHENDLAAKYGLEAHLLDQRQLQELDPAIEFRARGGLHVPADAHLVPAKLVKDLADYLKNSGATLVRDCEVKKIHASDRQIVSVETNRGKFAADEFVLAGGAWSPKLVRPLGLTMHLEAGKGYSITFSNPPVKPTRPYILTERRVAVTPFSDSLRFAGTMELAGINAEINQPRVEAILDAIPSYFKNIDRPSSSSGEVWGGMRPVTPDGLPYVGRFRQYPNLIAATGHAMLGISLATVTGKLVAELVAGQKPSHDLTLLNPNRYD